MSRSLCLLRIITVFKTLKGLYLLRLYDFDYSQPVVLLFVIVTNLSAQVHPHDLDKTCGDEQRFYAASFMSEGARGTRLGSGLDARKRNDFTPVGRCGEVGNHLLGSLPQRGGSRSRRVLCRRPQRSRSPCQPAEDRSNKKYTNAAAPDLCSFRHGGRGRRKQHHET